MSDEFKRIDIFYAGRRLGSNNKIHHVFHTIIDDMNGQAWKIDMDSQMIFDLKKAGSMVPGGIYSVEATEGANRIRPATLRYQRVWDGPEAVASQGADRAAYEAQQAVRMEARQRSEGDHLRPALRTLARAYRAAGHTNRRAMLVWIIDNIQNMEVRDE